MVNPFKIGNSHNDHVPLLFADLRGGLPLLDVFLKGEPAADATVSLDAAPARRGHCLDQPGQVVAVRVAIADEEDLEWLLGTEWSGWN